MPDCAIFANTVWEPKRVMDHLAQLREKLPFPVHEVSAGNIREGIMARRNTTGGRFAAIPWFTLNPDGSRGMGRRQCTREYKIDPIIAKIRALLGVPKGRRVPKGTIVEQWIGISMDEIVRMKPSRKSWIRHRWPLIEAGMDRRACERWLADRQLSAPKSACLGCPFHTNAMWRDLRDNTPDEWDDAVAVDRALREGDSRGFRAAEYMHPSRVPLDAAPIDESDDNQPGFDMECEGMCGA
jgi:hypothetical protein